MRTKSDKWIWILTKGRVVERNVHGMPIRMVGTQSDITVRRNAENKLIESEKRFWSLIYNSTEIMFSIPLPQYIFSVILKVLSLVKIQLTSYIQMIRRGLKGI